MAKKDTKQPVKQSVKQSVLEKMKPVKVSELNLLSEDENVVVHTGAQINLLKKNIQEFGQYRPIIIDENNKVLAGNALSTAMRELGYETIFAVKYGDLDETEKDTLMMVDNYSSEMNFFRNERAQEIALNIPDLDSWHLDGLVVTDVELGSMFGKKGGGLTESLSGATGATDGAGGDTGLATAPGTPGASHLDNFFTDEDNDGQKLKDSEVRCPNCLVVFKK